jgi:hypothetical protein
VFFHKPLRPKWVINLGVLPYMQARKAYDWFTIYEPVYNGLRVLVSKLDQLAQQALTCTPKSPQQHFEMDAGGYLIASLRCPTFLFSHHAVWTTLHLRVDTACDLITTLTGGPDTGQVPTMFSPTFTNPAFYIKMTGVMAQEADTKETLQEHLLSATSEETGVRFWRGQSMETQWYPPQGGALDH